MISGLDMLRALNEVLTEKEKAHFCDWIYSQQIEPRPGEVELLMCYLLILGGEVNPVHLCFFRI